MCDASLQSDDTVTYILLSRTRPRNIKYHRWAHVPHQTWLYPRPRVAYVDTLDIHTSIFAASQDQQCRVPIPQICPSHQDPLPQFHPEHGSGAKTSPSLSAANVHFITTTPMLLSLASRGTWKKAKTADPRERRSSRSRRRDETR